MGLSAAASVRVGNALGGGKPEQAKLSCKVPVVCTCKKQQSRCGRGLDVGAVLHSWGTHYQTYRGGGGGVLAYVSNMWEQ